MSLPLLAALMALFAILGTLCGYFLAQGLRRGYFSRRVMFPVPKNTALAGRLPGHAYRDRDPVGFWIEAGMQVLAVAVCAVMLGILLSVR